MTVKEEMSLKKRSLIVDTEDEDDFEKIGDEKNSDVIQEDSSKQPVEEQSAGILFYILERHQWIFAIWLIPISICYDIFMWFRARWNYWTRNQIAYDCKSFAKHIHKEKVTCSNIFNDKL